MTTRLRKEFDALSAPDQEPTTERPTLHQFVASCVRAGLPPIPVLMKDGNKKPLLRRWQLEPLANMSDAIQAFTDAEMNTNAGESIGVGICWGQADPPLMAVDCDSEEIAEWVKDAGRTGGIPFRTRRGWQVVFRQPDDMDVSNSTANLPSSDKIDIRGSAGFSVVYADDRPPAPIDRFVDAVEYPNPQHLVERQAVERVSSETLDKWLRVHERATVKPLADDLAIVQTFNDNAEHGRHPAMLVATSHMVDAIAAGRLPSGQLALLLEAYTATDTINNRGSRTRDYWVAVRGSIGYWQEVNDTAAAADTWVVDMVAKSSTGEASGLDLGAHVLPREFWEASHTLRRIREVAISRIVSPDAVLLVVLVRLACAIDPMYRLPAIVGGQGSLNAIVGLPGVSGVGKTSSFNVGASLVPLDAEWVRDGLSPSSGAGIAEAYYAKDGDGNRVVGLKRSAMFFADEGEKLMKAARREATADIMPVVRSAWTGSTLGEQNATEDLRRHVPAHTYRFGLVACFQADNAGALLASKDGDVQRFLWASTTHPDIAAEYDAIIARGVDDSPLAVGQPFVPGEVTELNVASSVVEEITRRRLAVASGQERPDPDDTHADLLRLKVAALLSPLLTAGRLTVGETEWALAGQVVETSKAVRQAIYEHLATSEEDERRRRLAGVAAKVRVEGDAAHRGAVDRAAQRVLSVLRTAGGTETRAGVRRLLSAPQRGVYDEALDELAASGALERLDGGERLRLLSGK